MLTQPLLWICQKYTVIHLKLETMDKGTVAALVVLAIPIGIAYYLHRKNKKRIDDILSGKIKVH